jgi:hypothetical protein
MPLFSGKNKAARQETKRLKAQYKWEAKGKAYSNGIDPDAGKYNLIGELGGGALSIAGAAITGGTSTMLGHGHASQTSSALPAAVGAGSKVFLWISVGLGLLLLILTLGVSSRRKRRRR